MEIITNNLDSSITLPKEINEKLVNKKYCFFDIETTGFNRYKNKVILIGLLYPTHEGIKIMQLFANDLKDEKELLTKFIGLISKFHILISYNGNTFDIPFLNKRFKYNNINYEINKDSSLDILVDVKKYKDLLKLDNCKLKSVEQRLGINREDLISGKESVELYYNYISNKNPDIKNIILKHNYDDIYNLPNILEIYSLIERSLSIGISVAINNEIIDFETNVNKININHEKLYIIGTTTKLNIHNQIYYGDNYSFNWDPKNGLFKLSFSIKSGKLSSGKTCLYLDQKMYFFPAYVKDLSDYTLPDGFILIKDNKNLLVENIKHLFKSFIVKITNELKI